MDRNRLIMLILVGLVIINLSWTSAIYTNVSSLDRNVTEVQTTQNHIQEQLVGATNVSNGSNAGFSSRRVTVPALAYDTTAREGVIVPFHVVTIAGDGIYTDTQEVTYDVLTQQSFRIAHKVAYNSTSAPVLEGVVISVDTPESWENVGGNSAGLATAMAITATSEDTQLKDGVVMTGGLTKDGEVTRVTHVREKAVAAREAGYDVFLVPYGQSLEIDGIRVISVSSFQEAKQYALASGRESEPAQHIRATR